MGVLRQPDDIVAQRYVCAFHGVGLSDEYPKIPYPDDWDRIGYDGEIEAGLVLSVYQRHGASLLHGQNNGQSGKIRRMPYVMPQQRKEKAGSGVSKQRPAPAYGSFFVGTDRGGCFVEHAIYKFVAVFCAKGFRQFDSFINRNFVRDIIAFRQFEQCNAQHRFFNLAQLFEQTGQVRLHQAVEIRAVSRHSGQQFTEVQNVHIFHVLFRQELVFNISDVVMGQLPGVERLDGTLTGAATSSRFHGIPLTKFRP